MAVSDTVSDYFGLEAHDTTVRTEVIAGLTTFLTMAYIIVVNPLILGDAITPEGVPYGRVLQMLAVVTILSSIVAMLVMAFYANRPFGLAPGMGLNAFFVVVVVTMGIPWEVALAAVFVEGLIFIALTAAGARKYIIQLFPDPVKFSVGAGIGLFLAIIGLENMHVVVGTPTNGTFAEINPLLAADPVAVVGLLGVLFTFALYARGVRGAIVIGIIATSLAGYAASALDYSAITADTLAESGFEGHSMAFAPLTPDVSDVTYSAAAYDITPLLGAFVDGLAQVEALTFALVVFTFFFVDFFDTAGTLTGLGQSADMLDEEGNLPDIDKPLMADAVGTTTGGILGTSTVTAFIESATGIEEGGRTGLTALVVAALFLLALAVVPLIAAVPAYASGIALVVVAVIMLRNVTDVQWGDVVHAVPAGLTILVMPFTGSIAYGIAAGLISYPFVAAAAGRYDETNVGQWILAFAFIAYFVVRTNVLL